MITGGIGDFLTFLWCVILGATLCMLYDLFKSVRLAVRLRGISLFFLDLLYFILAAILTFFMMLVRCFGEVRWFILAGELLGFVLMRLLCRERLSRLLAGWIGRGIRGVRWIRDRLIVPARWWFYRMFCRIAGGIWRVIKKLGIFLKKVLHPAGKLLYNSSIRVFSRPAASRDQTGRLKKSKRFRRKNSRLSG